MIFGASEWGMTYFRSQIGAAFAGFLSVPDVITDDCAVCRQVCTSRAGLFLKRETSSSEKERPKLIEARNYGISDAIVFPTAWCQSHGSFVKCILLLRSDTLLSVRL